MDAHAYTCECKKQQSEALTRLYQWRLRTNERDRLIHEAHATGARQIHIANAAKISRHTVARITRQEPKCQKP